MLVLSARSWQYSYESMLFSRCSVASLPVSGGSVAVTPDTYMGSRDLIFLMSPPPLLSLAPSFSSWASWTTYQIHYSPRNGYDDERQTAGQVQPEPIITPPAAASDTAAAGAGAAAAEAVAGAAGAAGARIRDAAEMGGRGLAARVELWEEEEGGVVAFAGGGGSSSSSILLVPSFCPSGPFERYAALHHDIVEGKLEPRCGAVLCGTGLSALLFLGFAAVV